MLERFDLPIAYRPARRKDWPSIRALLQSCNLPLAGAEDYLDTFLVAAVDGRIVGCAGIERHGDAALLRSVAVDAASRGQGVGVALTRRAVALAKKLDVRQLVLLSTSAEDFFPRFGFSPITRAQMPDSLTDSEEFRRACPASAHVMQLDLKKTNDR
jgi:amino-acid N-acetyltransferase